MVFGVCMKYLQNEDNAKDALMEVFENLIHLLKKHQIENFKPWLHSVVKNHCLMELRKEKKIPIQNVDSSEYFAFNMEYSVTQHPTNDNQESSFRLLEKGIELLNEDQKKCIELFYLQQKSYQDVCEMTGYSMNQVKSYIQNGKRNLKLFLDGKMNE